MCRYAVKDYKGHFVCFSCRKGFKKVSPVDFFSTRGLDLAFRELGLATSGKTHDEMVVKYGVTFLGLMDNYYESVASCPECGSAMSPMGLDFKVPSMDAIKKWKIIQILVNNDFKFFGCGCDVGYLPPESIKEMPRWLSEHAEKSQAEKLLKLFSDRA